MKGRHAQGENGEPCGANNGDAQRLQLQKFRVSFWSKPTDFGSMYDRFFNDQKFHNEIRLRRRCFRARFQPIEQSRDFCQT